MTPNNDFYARVRLNAQGNEIPPRQLLETHLKEVADLAAGFAAKFDSAEWGKLAGLWHDLGKYQQAFQRRLDDDSIRAEHSGAGAALASQKNKVLGLALAFAIAGHHAGLADPVNLGERLKNNQVILREALANAPRTIAEHSLPSWPKFLQAALQARGKREEDAAGRTLEFWTRFLLSALVDADRLNSEGFDDPAKSQSRQGFAPIAELRQRLDDHIDAKATQADKTPLNATRAQILRACREKASQEPGLFSLTVPTGGGKTLAAMSFALRHAERHDLRRVIVVIPYTSIIEQNAKVYREALGAENVVEHHSTLDPQQRAGGDPQFAQREELAAENWDAPVIVTTNVQFLESLFSNKTSRCRKLHNIAKSVIILDEVQTLPPEFLESILDALKELAAHYGCSIVLSTATPPALLKRESLPGGLEGVRPIIDQPVELAQRLRRVEYSWPAPGAEPLSWEALAQELAGHPQVLAIVHRRADARELAELLDKETGEENTFHLSALMCPAHRLEVIGQIKKALEEAWENPSRPCRVVSTQLVEAGVDLDFPVVYRALAGLDSIVQAAGRCNREGRLLPELGRVVVFKAPTKPPKGTLTTAFGIAEGMLREAKEQLDATNPDVFERFFRELYFARDLDAKKIQALRAALNFAEVGKEFQLIEDGFTTPVVVPWPIAKPSEGSLELLERVRKEGPRRELLRSLQRYTVSIYTQTKTKLDKEGALTPAVAGLDLLTLTEPFKHCYNERFGLIVGDDISPNIDVLIQ